MFYERTAQKCKLHKKGFIIMGPEVWNCQPSLSLFLALRNIYLYIYVCVCVRARVCVCVCVCVCLHIRYHGTQYNDIKLRHSVTTVEVHAECY
jgi:hypothetical protein